MLQRCARQVSIHETGGTHSGALHHAVDVGAQRLQPAQAHHVVAAGHHQHHVEARVAVELGQHRTEQRTVTRVVLDLQPWKRLRQPPGHAGLRRQCTGAHGRAVAHDEQAQRRPRRAVLHRFAGV